MNKLFNIGDRLYGFCNGYFGSGDCDQELDSGDILRCRQYIYEMEISMNGQGYVIGDPVTGKTVDGRLSEPYILDETGCLCSIDRLLGEKVIKELL